MESVGPAASTDHGPLRILLVDDDEDDFIITRDLLSDSRRLDAELIWAASGAEARGLLSGTPIDLVLLDVNLGGVSGLDLLVEIQRDGCTCPLIMLTGAGDDQVDQRCMDLGAADYLEKGPQLTVTLLERSILHALDRQRDRQNIALMTTALEGLSDGIFITDNDTRLLFANRAVRDLCGGNSGDATCWTVPTDAADHLTHLMELAGNHGDNGAEESGEIDFLLKHPQDRNLRTFSLSDYQVTLDQAQRHRLRLGIVRDVSEVRAAQAELDRFFKLSGDCLFVADASATILRVNPAWRRTLGFQSHDLVGRTFWSLFHDPQHPLLCKARERLENHHSVEQMERPCQGSFGHRIWMSWNLVPVPEQGLLYGSGRDMSERKSSEDALLFTSLHDSLTGLENRVCSLKRLQTCLQWQQRYPNRFFVLLFIDLDNFKNVNDRLGHAAGDQLLSEVARRLKQGVRATDHVARLGGDEFLVLLEDLDNQADALTMIERLVRALSSRVTLGSETVAGSASVGVVFSSRTYRTAESMIRDADIAMYEAKRGGKHGYRVFDASMSAQSSRLLTLEAGLEEVISRRELILAYQPIVNLADDCRLIGFEALLRWQHPQLGTISPHELVPIAEHNGLIGPIGLWVLESACRDLLRWQGLHPGGHAFTLNVNLSAKQLFDPELLQSIRDVLDVTGFPPRLLHLEVTETSLITNVALATHVLRNIQDLGIHLSLDDFGTGYSSLQYLQQFPISSLKIDKSFVRGIESNERDLRIACAVISLARSLELDVVAEGIETRVQMHRLQTLGCGLGQGYLFARPLSAEETEAYIRSQATQLEKALA
ncbi:GGDEF domain-containing response regulator [Synechococcus sp. RSCCF101]|uniref:EAL domain-containing protein n=1 Tax=Synechococcus sp. RSCCF101 TaxID=2511069 RepID=UPI001246E8E4|nr:EAL domain-containing protein [Synechococcus sp. RSCCF101]QEY30907.1 GGDEF domain-containing response regulator [Synechococcus sp. RSCCF101]